MLNFFKNKFTIIVLFLLVAGLFIRFSSLWIPTQQKIYGTYYQVTNPDKTTSGSRVDTINFFSNALGIQRNYTAYIPEGYNTNPLGRYPVLYLLHGDPGNERDWLVNANLATTVNQLIKDKKIGPLIVIMPDGNGPKIDISQYVNATTQQQNMEDFITEDLRKDAENRYRTIETREGRAIGGNSSGGFGAVNLGLRHNDLYGVILSFGAYFDNWQNELDPVFGNNQQALSANSPSVYGGSITISPNTYVYLADGTLDWGSVVNENKNFSKLLTNRGITNQLALISGIHTWTTWAKALPGSLMFLDQYIAKTTVK